MGSEFQIQVVYLLLLLILPDLGGIRTVRKKMKATVLKKKNNDSAIGGGMINRDLLQNDNDDGAMHPIVEIIQKCKLLFREM